MYSLPLINFRSFQKPLCLIHFIAKYLIVTKNFTKSNLWSHMITTTYIFTLITETKQIHWSITILFILEVIEINKSGFSTNFYKVEAS